MSLRAIGYLLTHAACLLSVRQKKKILRSKDKDVRFTELLIGGKKKIVRLGLKTSEHLLQISSLKQRALTLNQTLFVCISILVTSNSFTLRHLTFLSLNSTIFEPSFFSELWNIIPSNFNFTRIYSQIN